LSFPILHLGGGAGRITTLRFGFGLRRLFRKIVTATAAITAPKTNQIGIGVVTTLFQ
jgi:hypothetical protein